MAFDPTRNIDRFYVVQVLPTLFGDWTVLREWGRRGSPGTMRLESIMKPRPPSSARSAPAAARLSGRERHCLTTARWLATQLYHRCGVLPVEHDIEESASHPLSLQNGGQWPI